MNIWVTGYRKYELGIFNDKDEKIAVIKYALKKVIVEKFEEGLEWIITGPQMGIEQWTCEVVSELKTEYPELKLAVIEPFSNFGNNWNENNQDHLFIRRELADFVAAVSKDEYKNPSQLKNYQKFMLEHTNQAILVYDEEFEGKPKYDYLAVKKYAETTDYSLTKIDMHSLQEAAENYRE